MNDFKVAPVTFDELNENDDFCASALEDETALDK